VSSEVPNPPPQRSGLRGFWSRRSKWGKTGLIAGAILLVFFVIGLAVPTSSELENTADVETQTTEPTTTEEATTEAEPTTSEEAPAEEPEETDDGDTGRMSEGEYDSFNLFLTEVDEEIDQFANGIQRCGLLFQALELAAALECMDEAYSGFEEKVSFANVTVDDLRNDVAKDCLEALNVYQDRLNRFAAFVDNLYQSATNLQPKKFTRLSNRAERQTLRYVAAKGLALISCEPS
jgi:hypothetical protein